jgi:hypothetical protein
MLKTRKNNSSPIKRNSPPPLKKNISPPPPTTNTYIPTPSLFDSIKQGFGLGIGSSIGHRVVDSIFKPSLSNDELKDKKECNLTTSEMYDLYNKCLEDKKENSKCIKILENIN